MDTFCHYTETSGLQTVDVCACMRALNKVQADVLLSSFSEIL